MTDEAIAAWEKYKEEFESELIKTSNGYQQPEHRYRKDSITTTPKSKKRSFKKIVLSSSGEIGKPTPQVLTQSSLSSTEPFGSSPLEIPETQKQQVAQGISPRIVISPIRQSQRLKYLDIGSSPLRRTVVSQDPDLDESSQSLSQSQNIAGTPIAQSSAVAIGNTIPDSQPENSFHDSEGPLPDSSPPASRATSSSGEKSSRAVAPENSIVRNGNPSPHTPNILVQQLPTSPNSTSSESNLFDEPRSNSAESASTGIASDGEILSQTQLYTTSISASSAQQEVIPTVEQEELDLRGFETQIPYQSQSTPVHPGSSQFVDSSTVSTGQQAPIVATDEVSPSPSPQQQAPSNTSLKSAPDSSPRHFSPLRALEQLRRRRSMAGRSRESTPRSVRGSSAVPPISGQALGERLRNIRAPARALAEARHSQAATSASPPKASDLETEDPATKEPGAKNGMVESPDILQTTEQVSDQSAEITQAESAGASTDSSLPQVAVSSAAAEQFPIPKLTLASLKDDSKMVPQLDVGEYVVALPVEGKTLSQYLDIITSKEVDLVRFLGSDENPSGSLLGSISTLMDKLIMTTCHTDYVVTGPVTQSSLDLTREVQWAEYTSTKFGCLGQIFDLLRYEDLKVLIVSDSAQVRNGLDIYCTGKRIAHTVNVEPRSSLAESTDVEGLLKVLITSPEIALPPISDLVIVFDSFIKSNAKLHGRPQTSGGKISPAIHLVVQNSPEHALLCCIKEAEPPQILRSVAKEVFASRKLLGKIDLGTKASLTQYHDYNQKQLALKKDFRDAVTMAAKAVADCASQHDFETAWPYPVVEFDRVPLDIPPSLVAPSSPAVSRTGTPSGQKRPLDDLDGETSSKKLRLTPLQDIKRITDSMGDSTNQIDVLKEELRKLKQTLKQEREERVAETTKLKASLFASQNQIQNMTIEFRKLQHRYETRTKDVHTMRHSINKHGQEKAAEAIRRDKILSDIQGLKEERRALQEQLVAARATITGGGGTSADIETAQQQIRLLQKENASLLKSNENMKKDFDFTRQQYQNASTAAAESAAQNTELEEEVSKLRITASEEKRKLKEMNFTKDRNRYLDHIERSDATIRTLEKTVQRKEDELRTAKRGRGVQTRASSAQPGSPRLVGVGAGSRGSSPVPGGLTVGRMSALRNEG